MDTFITRLSYIVFIFLISDSINSQNIGNEWLTTGQSYVKLKVGRDGVYRINIADIDATGLTLVGTPAQNLKLYLLGQEIPIHVSNNGTLREDDFIEFYGEKHRIGIDTFLFDNWQKDILNTEYSLTSDTNTYFLTSKIGGLGLRYAQSTPDLTNVNQAPLVDYIHEELLVFNNIHFKNTDGDVRYSRFEAAEGFGSGVRNSQQFTLPISHVVPTGIEPQFSIRLGANNSVSNIEISLNNSLLYSAVLPNRLTTQFDLPIPYTSLSGSNLTFQTKNINSTTATHHIAWVKLRYARQWIFDNADSRIFELPLFLGSRYIEISQFAHQNQASPILYDITNKVRYNTLIKDNKVLALLNPTNKTSKYILAASTEKGILRPEGIELFTAKSWPNTGADYVILTDDFLQGSSKAIDTYADYRKSPEGGGYSVETVFIDDVYDHFGYGFYGNALAIKNFTQYIKSNWPDVRYVYMIGKGLEYPSHRTKDQILAAKEKTFFIPTFGLPGSDNMLFSDKNFPDPAFTIGRLAARTPEDVLNYLDKVKAYDNALTLPQTVPDKYWTKRVLHLGGGKNEFEQNAIRAGLENVARILRDSAMAADVQAFYKNSNVAVQFAVDSEIRNLFEGGINLINFFGHSSSGTWDFAIDNPRNFDNFGKYPIIFSLGCYSGNLHDRTKGISESFVMEKDRGSIAFYASTGTAFIGRLAQYIDEYYKLASREYRHKPISDIITALAKKYRNSLSSDQAFYSQMTYHGDPAVKFLMYPGPDFTFDFPTVKTQPNPVQASLETFNITMDIVNLGGTYADSIALTFVHEGPNGSYRDTIRLKQPIAGARQGITLTLKNRPNLSAGKHTLRGWIDDENLIKEWPDMAGENNNTLLSEAGIEYTFFVSDNIASGIYPANFGIVNSPEKFLLRASTNSAPVESNTYIFHIDTTRFFNSNLFRSYAVVSNGGFLEVKPDLPILEGTVYYWRISPDSTSTESYKWANQSFIYLADHPEGWNQSHYFQFLENNLIDLRYKDNYRNVSFDTDLNNVRVRNKLWEPDDQPSYFYNNVRTFSMNAWDWFDNGIAIIINNPINLWHLLNTAGGAEGSVNPTGRNIRVYSYKTDTPENRKKAMDFIEKELKEGYYLTLYTVQKSANSSYFPEQWAMDSILYGKSLFNVLESAGAQRVRELETRGAVPYILQLQKGNIPTNELIANDVYDIIDGITTLNSLKQNGTQTSPIIGPYNSIGEISFKYSGITDSLKENLESRLSIEGQPTLSPILLNDQPLGPLLTNTNAFRLVATHYDSTTRSAPQLDFWRLSYDALPDAAISPALPSEKVTDTLSQGSPIALKYKIFSTNHRAMDSILVKYNLTDQNNKMITSYARLAPLSANGILEGVYNSTLGLEFSDIVTLTIEINPDNDQKELFSFNNTLVKTFVIKKDDENPLLNIYFDGRPIMDNDIVSSQPEIKITLEDNNSLIPLTDINIFDVQLDTGRNQLYTVPLNDPSVRFTPATPNEGQASLLYTPTLKSGTYKLIVQGKDMTGNPSGMAPKTINFRVIEESTISKVLNYPNPFSTSTQFVFTLTGDEIPAQLLIRIYTVTGKVVKEISGPELGPLHIGVNRTDYKWDGTDAFGEKLGNGVYLYKVFAYKADGTSYESYDISDIDSFFTDGFGKMMIIR